MNVAWLLYWSCVLHRGLKACLLSWVFSDACSPIATIVFPSPIGCFDTLTVISLEIGREFSFWFSSRWEVIIIKLRYFFLYVCPICLLHSLLHLIRHVFFLLCSSYENSSVLHSNWWIHASHSCAPSAWLGKALRLTSLRSHWKYLCFSLAQYAQVPNCPV